VPKPPFCRHYLAAVDSFRPTIGRHVQHALFESDLDALRLHSRKIELHEEIITPPIGIHRHNGEVARRPCRSGGRGPGKDPLVSALRFTPFN
jgi:hypothetical protein